MSHLNDAEPAMDRIRFLLTMTGIDSRDLLDALRPNEDGTVTLTCTPQRLLKLLEDAISFE